MYVNTTTVAHLKRMGAFETPLERPRTVTGFTGKDHHRLTHQLNFHVRMGNHCDLSAPFTIMPLGQDYDVYVGWDYQKRYGFAIDAGAQTLEIREPKNPGLLKRNPDLWAAPRRTRRGDKLEPETPTPRDVVPLEKDEPPPKPEPETPPKRTRSKQSIQKVVQQKATQQHTTTRKKWSSTENVAPVSWSTYKAMTKKYGPKACGAMFLLTDKDGGSHEMVCRLVDADHPEATDRIQAQQVSKVTQADIDYQQKKRDLPATDPKTKVPEVYHDLLDVFSKEASDQLPPSRPGLDFKIELSGDASSIGYGRLTRLDEIVTGEVKRYLQENKRKDFIEDSYSSISSPILLVHKPGGGVRFCVDYRKLNSVTKKDRYAIPLIDETVSLVRGAKWLSKLDIRQAFNRILIDEESRDLTTFQTKFGAYRYKVMPFGVANGPATWQRLINQCLMEFLNEFCVAYLDDILIYSNTLEEHHAHVRRVLKRLKDWDLQVDVDKCDFHVKETKFLGVIVGTEGLRMDPSKIESITNWESPKSVRDVRSFLGFANFYRRFIQGFSAKAKPLTRLTGKDVPFIWGTEEQGAFDSLKKSVTSAPVLRHFDPNLDTVVETDASDINVGGVLSQNYEGRLHPVAFFSRTMTPAESNYTIYDKELLAIVTALEAWEPELKSVNPGPFTVYTDHQTLQWFTTTKKLQRRQIRWNEELAGYHFKIVYRPGKANGKADALTRRTQDQITKGDERESFRYQTLLPPERLDDSCRQWNVSAITRSQTRPTAPELEPDQVEESEGDSSDSTNQENPGQATPEMPLPQKEYEGQNDDEGVPGAEVIDQVQRENEGDSEEMRDLRDQVKDIKAYRIKNKLLYVADRLYVPESHHLRERLIKHIHEQPALGHPATARLWAVMNQRYYFPKMRELISSFVKKCATCAANRKSEKTNGLLQPLPVGERPWQDLTLDFITGLEQTPSGNDAILVVCDQFSKAKHYIECSAREGGTGAAKTANMLIKRVISLHGLPTSIVSDRGPQFVAEMWKELMRRMKTDSKLTTPHHPQSDGQTERANQELEKYLRGFVNWMQDDWDEWLPFAELATNALMNASTGMSPFFICHGFEPRMSFDNSPPAMGRRRTAKLLAAEKAKLMQQIWERTQSALALAKQKQTFQANKQRKQPGIRVGDSVFVSAKHLDTGRPRKLGPPNVGPYKVVTIRGNWAALDLPQGSQVTNKFNVERLSKFDDKPLPGQREPPPPPELNDENDKEWVVEKILDARLNTRRGNLLQFRVQWKGYPIDTAWWDADDGSFDNAQHVVLDWYKKHNKKGIRLPRGWSSGRGPQGGGG